MERGLRQGDPLSPLLFVLVVDVLHRMLEEAVRNGRITLLLVGRDHIELSHLQFADDTILFCPPKTETIVNYKRLLCCFELMSVCKQASLPVRYLRISLGANPCLVKTWKPVIDKVEEKLSLWKAKVLNKAGVVIGDSFGGDTSYSFTNVIWKGLVLPRIELFDWFVLVGRVNTKERLSRLGILHQHDSICVLCKKESECVHHLFVFCEFTWQVWCVWLRCFHRDWAVPGSIKGLFKSWNGTPNRKKEQRRWLTGFFAVIWNVWLECNNRIFNNKEVNVDVIQNMTFLSSKEWTGIDPTGY
ncbi:uncharacterized protein [Arachis hypogaea]|uniref:uncharacterized protein n=1 Tax=Arachis hypogaea TaxID=3818 RepID=UPI003B228E91